MESVGAAVKIVFTFVGGHTYLGVAHHECGTLDAVSIPAHHSAQISAVAGAVTICIVVAQNHIIHVAVFVGYHQRYQMCAEICNRSGQFTTRDCVEAGLGSVG